MSRNITGPNIPLIPVGDKFYPYHLPIPCGRDHPENWVVCGAPNRVSTFEDLLDNFKIIQQDPMHEREFKIGIGKYKDVEIGVGSSGIGTDNTEIFLRELNIIHEYDPVKKIWTRKSEDGTWFSFNEFSDFNPLNIIRVGTSGSPNSTVKLPSIAISEYAIGFDNTGNFLKSEYDEDLSSFLKKAKKELRMVEYVSRGTESIFKELKQSVRNIDNDLASYSGITASSPGFYECQGRAIGIFADHMTYPNMVDDLNKFSYKGRKVVNWEMETSCLFDSASIPDYRTGSVCAVLGNRVDDTIASPEDIGRSVEMAAKVALETLTSLA